ncbi:MAG: hypothetical protein NTY48_03235, partial [Candidatus Diapherotrites archaeon]|nr:hypothetical protein [Candidatus Diapherotrites archaeon]
KIEHMLEPEKFHFLDYSQREHLWRDIISPKIINGQKTTPRSIEDTKEEIIKWKSRVPKLAQGEY